MPDPHGDAAIPAYFPKRFWSPRTDKPCCEAMTTVRLWRRLKVDQDLEFDDCVRCLLPDPGHPSAVFAGAETGLFRRRGLAARPRHRIDCELNTYAVWKLVADRRNPNIMYAGTGSPTHAAFFQFGDAGRSWQKDDAFFEMPPKCAGVRRPRMLYDCDRSG